MDGSTHRDNRGARLPVPSPPSPAPTSSAHAERIQRPGARAMHDDDARKHGHQTINRKRKALNVNDLPVSDKQALQEALVYR